MFIDKMVNYSHEKTVGCYMPVKHYKLDTPEKCHMYANISKHRGINK